MIKMIPTLPEHFESLVLKDVYEHKDAIEFSKSEVFNSDVSYSILADDKVIAIVYGTIGYPGVMSCSGLFTDMVAKYKVAFHRCVKIIVDVVFKAFNLHRMQAVVRADYLQGQRWIEALGFAKEGLMKMYGANADDYYMYGRTL